MKRSVAVTLTAIFASLAFAVRFFWIGVIPLYATMKLDLRDVFVLIGACLVPPQYAWILGVSAGLGSGVGFDDIPFIANSLITSSLHHKLRFKQRHILAMLVGETTGILIFFFLYTLGGMIPIETLPIVIPTFFALRAIPNIGISVIIFSSLIKTRIFTALNLNTEVTGYK